MWRRFVRRGTSRISSVLSGCDSCATFSTGASSFGEMVRNCAVGRANERVVALFVSADAGNQQQIRIEPQKILGFIEQQPSPVSTLGQLANEAETVNPIKCSFNIVRLTFRPAKDFRVTSVYLYKERIPDL